MGRQYRRRHGQRDPIKFEVEIPLRHLNDDGSATNDWQLVEFTCRGAISSLHVSELMHNSDLSTATPEGMTILRNTFASAFGDEAEYRRFLRDAVPYLDDEQLMEILQDLVEDFAGRPTGQSPSSSTEPTPTGTDSKVVSLPGGFAVASAG